MRDTLKARITLLWLNGLPNLFAAHLIAALYIVSFMSGTHVSLRLSLYIFSVSSFMDDVSASPLVAFNSCLRFITLFVPSLIVSSFARHECGYRWLFFVHLVDPYPCFCHAVHLSSG